MTQCDAFIESSPILCLCTLCCAHTLHLDAAWSIHSRRVVQYTSVPRKLYSALLGSLAYRISSTSESSTGLACDQADAGDNALSGDCIWAYFVYTPKKAADIFFLIFFCFLTLLVAFHATRARQLWLHSLTLFRVLEASGYLARAVLLYNTNETAFTAELVIIILAPNCLAFCCYVLLGRIITYVVKTKSDG